MRAGLRKLLITGGAGFIGSAFVRLAVKKGYRVIVCDKLTYAGDLARLNEVKDKYKFYKIDICSALWISQIFKKEKPDAVVHFAAETHVDRSIQNAAPFIKTNILGTQVLLDVSRKYNIKEFIYISTDECYGEIKKGSFNEDSPLRPNSPYAASKAAADLLVRAYMRTYNFPVIIVRPCNNYGPWQYPEKLIPVVISRALKDKKIPVYAKGLNIREWLYVDDCAVAILKVIEKGRIGDIYNIGPGNPRMNISMVKEILNCLGKPHRLIQFVKDRPGHDIRYSLNCSKVKNELGWEPKLNFNEGIQNTIEWYKNNIAWLKNKANRKAR